MPPRITRKSYRPRASDRTMVGIFEPHCLSPQKPLASSRPQHDSAKKRTPRASQHYLGWRDWQKSWLLPVLGKVFLLTLPFIECPYRRCGVLARNMSGNATREISQMVTQLPQFNQFVVPGVVGLAEVPETLHTVLPLPHAHSGNCARYSKPICAKSKVFWHISGKISCQSHSPKRIHRDFKNSMMAS